MEDLHLSVKILMAQGRGVWMFGVKLEMSYSSSDRADLGVGVGVVTGSYSPVSC